MATVTVNRPATEVLSVGSILSVAVTVGAGAIVQRLYGGAQVESVQVSTIRHFGPYRHDMTFRVSCLPGAEAEVLERQDTDAINPTVREASYYGIRAGTSDMTRNMEIGLNAAHYDSVSIIMPYEDVNISGEVVVTAPNNSQTYATSAGIVNWRKPAGITAYGPLSSRIVQNQAGVGGVKYLPTTGNIAHAGVSNVCAVNVNEDYTDARQFGFQFGGGPNDCVSEGIRLHNVTGIGVYSVVRVDDCTGLFVTGTSQNGRFKYYVEAGYNADQFSFRDFLHSHDHPVNVSCTSSTGTTISGISAAVMPFLLKGASITGAGVPADTTIIGKGDTSITVSPAVTSVTSFTQHLGTLLSLLGTTGSAYTGSGWAAIANAAGYYNKTRASNPNCIVFDNVLFNRAEGLVEDYGSSYALGVNVLYMEKPKKLMTFAGAGLKQLDIDRIVVSQPESLRQPMITIASSVPQGTIRNCGTDGSPNTSIFVSAPNMNSNTEFGPFEVIGCTSLGGVLTGGGPLLRGTHIRLGTKQNGTVSYAVSTADGDINFDGMGVDEVEITLERSGRGVPGPNSVQIPVGREIGFTFIQSGSGNYTINLGAQYVKPDGTGWGTLTGGATGTRAYIRFRYTGTKYVSTQSAAVYA